MSAQMDFVGGIEAPIAANPDAWFETFKSIYPKRAGGQPWNRALKAAHARLKQGRTIEQMLEGAQRYALFVQSTGKEHTEFVKQAATFLGPDEHFLESWDLPIATERQHKTRFEIAREALNRA